MTTPGRARAPRLPAPGPTPVAAARHSRPLGAGVIAALAATLVLLLAHAWQYRFLTDDAFISFRYARNFAHGHGLVFNPGFERVEGYSNFLWVVILAGLDSVGLAPERMAIPLGLLLTLGLWAAVVAATLRRRASFGNDAWVVVPPLLLAVTRTVAVWATSGLETRLFELLVTCGLLRLADETDALREARAPGPAFGALLLGLAALTRPDGALIGVTALAASLAIARVRDPRVWIARVAPFVALGGGLEIFRLAYYHAWAPNTYYAKVGGRLEWPLGFEYVATFALEYAAFLWIPLVAIGAAHARRSGGRALVAIAAAALLPHLAYVIAIGGDHFEWRPLGLLVPLGALFAGEGLAAWATRRAAWLPLAACAALVGGSVLLPWVSHREFPTVYSSGFPGFEASAGPESERFLDPGANAVTRLPGLDAWGSAHRALLRRITARFAGVRQEEHRMFLELVSGEARAIRSLFDRGLLPADTWLAMDCVGVIPYVSGARTLDRLGLTDAKTARQPFATELTAHGKHASFEDARQRGVDLWFDDPAQLTAPLASSRFMRAWIEARGERAGVAALEADGTWLLAELPRGLEATRARLPRWRVFPLADSSARELLRPRLVEAWRARLSARPTDDEALDALGYLLMEAGRAAEAAEAYRALVALRPGDEDARANLGEALRRAESSAGPRGGRRP